MAAHSTPTRKSRGLYLNGSLIDNKSTHPYGEPFDNSRKPFLSWFPPTNLPSFTLSDSIYRSRSTNWTSKRTSHAWKLDIIRFRTCSVGIGEYEYSRTLINAWSVVSSLIYHLELSDQSKIQSAKDIGSWPQRCYLLNPPLRLTVKHPLRMFATTRSGWSSELAKVTIPAGTSNMPNLLGTNPSVERIQVLKQVHLYTHVSASVKGISSLLNWFILFIKVGGFSIATACFLIVSKKSSLHWMNFPKME